jgi:hypothetical protein
MAMTLARTGRSMKNFEIIAALRCPRTNAAHSRESGNPAGDPIVAG